MISADIFTTVFVVIWLASCLLIVFVFKYVNHIKVKKNKDYTYLKALSIALPIALFVWIAYWEPTNLFVVGGNGNNLFVNHYYLLYDTDINGNWISKNAAHNYIYNGSQTIITLEKQIYGYVKNNHSSSLIHPKQLYISSGKPTLFFERLPYSRFVKKGTLTDTVWAINKNEKKEEEKWSYEEAKRKAEAEQKRQKEKK